MSHVKLWQKMHNKKECLEILIMSLTFWVTPFPAPHMVSLNALCKKMLVMWLWPRRKEKDQRASPPWPKANEQFLWSQPTGVTWNMNSFGPVGPGSSYTWGEKTPPIYFRPWKRGPITPLITIVGAHLVVGWWGSLSQRFATVRCLEKTYK